MDELEFESKFFDFRFKCNLLDSSGLIILWSPVYQSVVATIMLYNKPPQSSVVHNKYVCYHLWVCKLTAVSWFSLAFPGRLCFRLQIGLIWLKPVSWVHICSKLCLFWGPDGRRCSSYGKSVECKIYDDPRKHTESPNSYHAWPCSIGQNKSHGQAHAMKKVIIPTMGGEGEWII